MLDATATAIPLPPLCHRLDPRAPEAAGLDWWLCHARSRAEKALAAELRDRDVPHLLPLCRSVRVTACRHRIESALPIFPGYLFVAGDELDYLNARQSRRVVHLIPVVDVPRLLTDLRGLLAAIDAGLPLGPSQALTAGDPVVVTSGPLEGTHGTFARQSGREYLLLHVACLGRVVPIAVEAWRVAPARIA